MNSVRDAQTDSQWWKRDQNCTTKTKTKIVRPRPINQQQDYITKKLFCCNTHVCYQKTTLCKNVKKWYDDQLHLALFLHLLHEKIQTGVYYISALSCHTVPVGHNSVGSKTKSIRPRLRLRPVWDQSCHKTAVSDPKSADSQTTFWWQYPIVLYAIWLNRNQMKISITCDDWRAFDVEEIVDKVQFSCWVLWSQPAEHPAP